MVRGWVEAESVMILETSRRWLGRGQMKSGRRMRGELELYGGRLRNEVEFLGRRVGGRSGASHVLH